MRMTMKNSVARSYYSTLNCSIFDVPVLLESAAECTLLRISVYCYRHSRTNRSKVESMTTRRQEAESRLEETRMEHDEEAEEETRE